MYQTTTSISRQTRFVATRAFVRRSTRRIVLTVWLTGYELTDAHFNGQVNMKFATCDKRQFYADISVLKDSFNLLLR